MKTRVSIVMPFYNEEANVEGVVTELLTATATANWDIDFVCVQNGSRDQTGAILQRLTREHSRVSMVDVAINRGYGFGIRQGLVAATGDIVGYLDGDGQVSPEDVLRVLDGMGSQPAAKAIRVQRQDGPQRLVISWCYNQILRLLFFVLFRLHARDANAKPKFLRRANLRVIDPVSDDWFIDAEIMIKAASIGTVWSEQPVKFLKRKAGRSNVRLGTILEFLRNLVRWRFGGRYSAWKAQVVNHG